MNRLRSEALQVLLALLQRDSQSRSVGNLDQKIELAIHAAKTFHKKIARHQTDGVVFPKSQPIQKYGEFTPSGYSIYFLTSDGSSFLVAEYASIPEAVGVAIALNAYLKQMEAR
ncbi:hypothetical protein [Picosynechococcus sp. NKBG042902]|uniref:hypothetical protein n=1 Tax=Picosynechococcus sp. NKBG042902 TaxID=490193 RepID=UPI0004AB20E4|nr:hypothetical protein [Picosynechococcus sp. NKBG042902]